MVCDDLKFIAFNSATAHTNCRSVQASIQSARTERAGDKPLVQQ